MKVKDYIKNGAWKGTLHNVGMKVAAAKPEIMLIVGGVSLLVGTIYACTKTEEAKKVAEEAKTENKKIDDSFVVPEDIDILPNTKRQMKLEKGRQYTKLYTHIAWKMLKIYGIPALMWFGGMGLIVGAHGSLRRTNAHLAADIFASNKLLQEYRQRVAKAIGEETEKKLFMGAKEEMISLIEIDPDTGKEKVVKKKADVFYDQPGSIFALNFTEETSDAFDVRSFADYYLESRWNAINKDLDLGMVRAYSGLDICRKLGFNENAFGDDEELLSKLLSYGISGNARKVPDPEMRKLKITKLKGYQKRWDNVRNMDVYVPCLRLDFNFYPLEGKI